MILRLLFLLAAAQAKGTGDPGSLYCGNWQAEYSRLHSSILRGEAPPRFAVSIAIEAGFADNVVGIISEFYFALLSNRAFQITTHDPIPSYRAAFNSPNINWTRHVDDPEEIIAPIRHLYQGERKYGPEIDPTKYAGVYLINDDHETWKRGNLRQWPDGGVAETVFLCSNRGKVVSLFDNPYHKQELYNMGLRPDTIFACGYNFLFEPNDAVKDMFELYMRSLQSAPSALKIGIGIRAGDAVFNGHKVSETFGDAYVGCAMQIEADWKKSNQSVIWCGPGSAPEILINTVGIFIVVSCKSETIKNSTSWCLQVSHEWVIGATVCHKQEVWHWEDHCDWHINSNTTHQL